MTEAELIEQLAAWEHRSWAAYMGYLLESYRQADGTAVIEAGHVSALLRQVQTPYADLSDDEQQADRDEVEDVLPIIKAYTLRRKPMRQSLKHRLRDGWVYVRFLFDYEWQRDFRRWLACAPCQHTIRQQEGDDL